MHLHHDRDEVQPQPMAGSRPAGIESDKSLHHSLAILFRDPSAIVDDADGDFVLAAFQCNVNGGSGRRVGLSVVEKIT